MQETRRLILEILRKRGYATVDEIVEALRQLREDDITPVTVRHHLGRLLEEDLVTTPQLRRRTSPGRPQYVYTLSHKAREQFPSNYQNLVSGLLVALRNQLPPEGVNVILEGVADQWADQAAIPDLPMFERMNLAVLYLTQQGYEAEWEIASNGYILHTLNCPYHAIAEREQALCDMDIRLIATLLNVVPRRLSHIIEGDQTCSYLIPEAVEAQ
jgi:predicted ArsR family transcriptional regulator